MGIRSSKTPNHQFSSKDSKPYQSVMRAYAKWDRRPGLVSHDESRVAINEIKNLEKHKHNKLLEADEQEQNQHRHINKPPNIPQIKLQPSISNRSRHSQMITDNSKELQRSRSLDPTFYPSNLVTAEQILHMHKDQQRRYRQSFTNLSVGVLEKSPTTQNVHKSNPLRTSKKPIPIDLQLVLIDRSDLQNHRAIGKGNFGVVYHALFKGTRDVAVKVLNSQQRDSLNVAKSSTQEYAGNINELLHEAYVMKHLQHENLLCIIGVTFFGKYKDLGLVTDYMKNGSLLHYLRQHRNSFNGSDPQKVVLKLNRFAKQIFDAMLYLEERNVIHRDLAARNCLIGEDDTLKVSDFGLTKLTDCGLYKATYRTICAIRWTSPEAQLYSRYTSLSDVWSYGITLWEIYSLGERPFGSLSNVAVKAILRNPLENLSRHLPLSNRYASDEVYHKLMLRCLTYNPDWRPHFRDLVQHIRYVLNENI